MKDVHPDPAELQICRDRTLRYLTSTLLPFWLERSPDPAYGGFLTYFDRSGRATGETVKTFLMQIRMLYTMASAHRAGYGDGRCGDLARRGARFILDHYWDNTEGGWIWIADRSGTPIIRDKVGYGQCFALYAFSEYYLATGDTDGLQAADQTWHVISSRMADRSREGYFELMEADWTPKPPGRSGGDRKSFDVHMHLMESLTTYYEAKKTDDVRSALLETIRLIESRMIDPATGTGGIQYTLDFEPIPAIIFDTQWGRDADPADGVARPLDTTSYGHNVEFAWLLLHALEKLGRPATEGLSVVRPIFDQCVRLGIDWEYGGVFVEGPAAGQAVVREKQFWQQAEVLVGMLDAYRLLGDPIYWKAFKNVYDFVFDRFIVREVGEWYERLDRKGSPIDDALGHAWKISYHTVRSMIQTIDRLQRLLKI